MRQNLRLALATTTVASLTCGLLCLPVGAATAAPPAASADDFNGDGYRDYASASRSTDGGAVHVVFGTAHGPGTASQTIDQDSPGVPGADEPDDIFGEMRAAGDFNRDGYGDLAVSARGEDVNGREDQGAVTILWGSKKGLSGGTSLPGKATPQPYGYFGDDLAAGDFNGDGRPELAVINAGETYVYQGTFSRTGISGPVAHPDRSNHRAAHLIAGQVTKDRATDLVILGVAAFPESRTEANAWFLKGGANFTSGTALSVNSHDSHVGDGLIADFDKDGYGDIAIGNPDDAKRRGAVTVWRGGAQGPTTATRITQATAGIAGTPEPEDSFGASISAGDINHDGYADLAIGAYGEKLGDKEYAGAVHVLRGRAGGLSGSGSQFFTRSSPGVPGSPDTDDSFGATVRLRDTDGDGFADLFVAGTGGSLRLPGSASGLTTTGVTSVDADLVDGFLQ
ncbi:hypothetical protein DY245_32725 [Streptomyces inhibens]|uniref:Integrin-like protein n=1 Tax=Streptomyces inhibens TaxID=2293571 RepID=A0A371PVA8_STRIH|nr:FG-GAP and VCBS repeat-containing protein [Streptomyces inhibens]REK86416.1 hypothetical protein DY245_32725 [Streptomyces inhibens]